METLITSMTRLKLLLRFLLNQNLIGYLQGLNEERDEDTNSVRLLLNLPKEVGLFSAKEKGRQKVYSVNKAHQLINRMVSRIRYTFKLVWVKDVMPMGITGDEVEVTLVGYALNTEYLDELMVMLETIIEKTIKWQVFSSDSEIDPKTPLLVWQKQNEEWQPGCKHIIL